MPYEAILALGTGVLCIILLIVLFFVVRDKNFGKDPQRQHRRISRCLRRYAGIRSFRVLDDITVPFQGRVGHVDHLLIGFFGVLAVCDLTARGDYYGDVRDENWVHISDNRRTRLPNAAQQMSDCIACLREQLSKRKTYNIPFTSILVVADKKKKTTAALTKTPQIVYFKELKGYLHRAAFDKDCDIDVPALTDLLTEIRQSLAE